MVFVPTVVDGLRGNGCELLPIFRFIRSREIPVKVGPNSADGDKGIGLGRLDPGIDNPARRGSDAKQCACPQPPVRLLGPFFTPYTVIPRLFARLAPLLLCSAGFLNAAEPTLAKRPKPAVPPVNKNRELTGVPAASPKDGLPALQEDSGGEPPAKTLRELYPNGP